LELKGEIFYVMISVSKDDLVRLSISEGKKIDEIANIYGVSHGTISRWFKKYNIPTKNSVGYDYEIFVGEYIKELHEHDFMYDLYVTQGKSIQDIADEYGKTCYYISKCLTELGIDRRSANATRWNKEKNKNKNCGLDEDVLYELFMINGLSTSEIAKMYDIYEREVKRRLKKYKIYKSTIKKQYYNSEKYLLDVLPKEIVNHDMLYKLYQTEKHSCQEIADMYNVSIYYVKRAMKYFGIKMRTQSESAKLMVGEKSQHWKGVNYSLYEKLRAYSRDNLHKKVKERDAYQCQMCGSEENLHVHHKKPLWKIYYEILDEHPEYNQYENVEELYDIMVQDGRVNDLNNLVTYCEECHLFKAHGYTHKQVEALKDRRRIKYFR